MITRKKIRKAWAKNNGKTAVVEECGNYFFHPLYGLYLEKHVCILLNRMWMKLDEVFKTRNQNGKHRKSSKRTR
jgi:hypothetical protein